MEKGQTVLGLFALGVAALLVAAFLGRDVLLRRGRTIDCTDGPRQTIDAREFATRTSAYAVTFEAQLGESASLSGKLDPVQLVALSEAAQQAAEFRKFLVAGYNSCAVSSEQFRVAGARFQALDGLSRQIDALGKRPALEAADRERLALLTGEYVRRAGELAAP